MGSVTYTGGAAYNATFNFNGGTLKALANNNTDFLGALQGTGYIVKSGGAKIDSNGKDITIAQPLLHDSTLGPLGRRPHQGRPWHPHSHRRQHLHRRHHHQRRKTRHHRPLQRHHRHHHQQPAASRSPRQRHHPVFARHRLRQHRRRLRVRPRHLQRRSTSLRSASAPSMPTATTRWTSQARPFPPAATRSPC